MIAEINCEKSSKNEVICESYDLEYYPTYILFHNGKEVDNYIAMKTKRQLKKYVEKFIKKQTTIKDET